MQSKIAHKAERAAFGLALDQIIKAASGPDREKNLDKLLDMAGNLLKDTAPGAIRGIRNGLYPGSKWEQFLWDVIDNTDRHVLKTSILNGAYEAAFRGLRNTTANAEKYQCNVPWIILFDPTSACNKHCVGCWAADYGNMLNLTYEEMDRLVTEGSELGCHLYMLTGGEPLVRKKDVVRLAEAHNDCLFNIFTNASLIDQAFCDDVKRVGNIVFSVSLEGTEDSNDGRRGDGSYKEVMAAFDLMRENGLLFGTSTAYTRANTEMVSSDEYFDTIISKGCRWAWYFHYMPVGEGATVDLCPSVAQREYMLRPCPMLENPEILPEIVHESDAQCTEYVTPEDVDHLCARTSVYAKSWEQRAEELWLEQHPTGKKIYADELSDGTIAEKAKLIAEHDAEAEKALQE